MMMMMMLTMTVVLTLKPYNIRSYDLQVVFFCVAVAQSQKAAPMPILNNAKSADSEEPAAAAGHAHLVVHPESNQS